MGCFYQPVLAKDLNTQDVLGDQFTIVFQAERVMYSVLVHIHF